MHNPSLWRLEKKMLPEIFVNFLNIRNLPMLMKKPTKFFSFAISKKYGGFKINIQRLQTITNIGLQNILKAY